MDRHEIVGSVVISVMTARPKNSFVSPPFDHEEGLGIAVPVNYPN